MPTQVSQERRTHSRAPGKPPAVRDSPWAEGRMFMGFLSADTTQVHNHVPHSHTYTHMHILHITYISMQMSYADYILHPQLEAI